MPQIIEVVVGGQYGSEAKGHVTAQLLQQAHDQTQAAEADWQVINVRVAGPNAGHTVYDSEGSKFALRTIPVGAAISDDIICYIAPGSEFELAVFVTELELLWLFGHRPTIRISSEATLLEDRHKVTEGQAKLTERVGSTGKGIGAARADRIMRKASRICDDPEVESVLLSMGVEFIEPRELYAGDEVSHTTNQHIIIEGTQGYGLGLHAGHYPQVTSSDCRAIDFLAMAGLSPWKDTTIAFWIWVVARAYPIRVAGNSGPMKDETSWEALGLPEEHTTVTQKVRRVGAWDGALVAAAVQANGGHTSVKVALTMADQVFPEITGFNHTNADRYSEGILNEVMQWATAIEAEVGAPVAAVTTSPTTIVYREAVE